MSGNLLSDNGLIVMSELGRRMMVRNQKKANMKRQVSSERNRVGRERESFFIPALLCEVFYLLFYVLQEILFFREATDV